MYFSFFPKGTYDLKGDGVGKAVTNLLARVKVRSKVIDEASLYDLYDIPEGDTPEEEAPANEEVAEAIAEPAEEVQH